MQPGQTQVTNAWANSAWGGSTQLSATSGTSSNVATAIATLIGDKGTTLDCVMQIQPGFSPHGIGTARDNAGREYRIQF